MVQAIERDLLPTDKRATFHDLLNVKQEVISASNSTTEDTSVIRVQGTFTDTKLVQTGLDEYFGTRTVTTNTGISSIQRRIAVDPSVITVYVDVIPSSTVEESKAIAYSLGPIDIKNYRSASLTGNTSPNYMARSSGQDCKNEPDTGRFHGLYGGGTSNQTS